MESYNFDIGDAGTNVAKSMRFMVFRNHYKDDTCFRTMTLSYLPTRELANQLVSDLIALYKKSGTYRQPRRP
jgi:hypothetical protein